jgi:hypothetical protein
MKFEVITEVKMLWSSAVWSCVLLQMQVTNIPPEDHIQTISFVYFHYGTSILKQLT